MKNDKVEMLAVQGATDQSENSVLELTELQLVLVGGGGGDVIFF